MSWWNRIVVTLGTILAIVVFLVLGIIGWFLYQAMGFIVVGIVVAGLIYYIFFSDKPTKSPP